MLDIEFVQSILHFFHFRMVDMNLLDRNMRLFRGKLTERFLELADLGAQLLEMGIHLFDSGIGRRRSFAPASEQRFHRLRRSKAA